MYTLSWLSMIVALYSLLKRNLTVKKIFSFMILKAQNNIRQYQTGSTGLTGLLRPVPAARTAAVTHPLPLANTLSV